MLHCRLQLRVWLDSSSLCVLRSHQTQSPPPPPHESHLTWGMERYGKCDSSRYERLPQINQIFGRTHAVSDTISPWTPVKPRVPATTAAAAMVLTLFGASGHNSATEPLNKTRLPSPSVQSERTSPVRRKQEGCLDILMNKAWKQDKRRNAHSQSLDHMKSTTLSNTTPALPQCYLQGPTIIQPLDVLASPQCTTGDVERPTILLSRLTQLLVQIRIREGRGRAHLRVGDTKEDVMWLTVVKLLKLCVSLCVFN